MRFSWFVSNLVVGAIVLLCLAVTGPANAQKFLKWSFTEGNDAASRGRRVARLTYGVPETDNQLLAGVCEARSGTSVSFSTLTLSVDVGRLKNGTKVRVRFVGGGTEYDLIGEVTGVGNTNEGISGVIVRPKHDDKLWSMMSELPAVAYLVPGHRKSALDLKGGKSSIRSFVSACQSYEKSLQPAATPSAAATAGSGISEKEAFELAKELGTVEGWNAFLSEFPNGSRARFARAFITRLSGSGGAANTTAPATNIAQPKPAGSRTPTLQTVARGPGSARWNNQTERMAILGGRSVYTASVRVPGVELVTYCVNDANGLGLGAVVRRKGSYPAFARRIQQGLAARPQVAGSANRQIKIEFSNGEVVVGGAAKPSLIGGTLGIGPNAASFVDGGAELEYLMSENSVSVELEPFMATFQLSGSRKAICSVMNRCGAQHPGCQRLRCGKNYTFVRGECVLKQNCGRNAYRNAEGDCFCREGFQRTGSGRCSRIRRECGGGEYRNAQGRCVSEGRNCGRGRTWVGAQGRCVCVNGNKVWNGRRCVTKRRRCSGGRQLDRQTGECFCPGDSDWNGRHCVKDEGPPPPKNNVKKNVCTILQAACQFGSKAACKNFNKNGC